ncbi:MAG: winged helix-turn-helix transcriptional regulator [Desulfatibacillaceae bacterium]
MKVKRDHRTCSVGRSLRILGDLWIFFILREAFFGVRHFDRFQENLGIATNILSDRLKTLVEHGIMKRERDEQDARRIRYNLTKKGVDLYPVVLALMKWGDRWLADETGPPLLLRHEACGKPLDPQVFCAACNEKVNAWEVSWEPGPGALDSGEGGEE